jgi:hypothetical protein
MRAVCAPRGLPRTAPHQPEELLLEVRRERREREERERRDEWEERRVRRVREDKNREKREESKSKKIDREIHHAVCVYHMCSIVLFACLYYLLK